MYVLSTYFYWNHGCVLSPDPPLNVSVEVNRSDPLLVGSSVTLTCRGSASPAAITYTWWYSSDVSNSSTELQVGSGQVLSISSVELAHTGTYICQAQNRAGQSRSAELLLAVEETGRNPGGREELAFLQL